MRIILSAIFLLLCAGRLVQAQFTILDSQTTASLRGIDALSPQIAWASGSSGTVLLTIDGGQTWKHCATPKGAEKLDFRGVQAFDAQTAVIMASGPGPLSAIYKTTDSCATWKLVFANPDITKGSEGFFDGLHKATERQLYLLGDPVNGKFAMFYSADKGDTWFIADDPGLDAPKGIGAFAASNSSLISIGPFLFFGTGASPDGPAKVYAARQQCATTNASGCSIQWVPVAVPVAASGTAAGVFSLAGRTTASMSGKLTTTLVAVGGDYTKSTEPALTAAFSPDGGLTWQPSATTPTGYRSAIAYAPLASAWIAVGPTGTDISHDDGRHWTPLKPNPTEPSNADQGWNAISLPFVVGAKGKIGRLREGALAK